MTHQLLKYFHTVPANIHNTNDLVMLFNDFNIVEYIDGFKETKQSDCIELFLGNAILEQGLHIEAKDVLAFSNSNDEKTYCVILENNLVLPIKINFTEDMKTAFWKAVSHYHNKDAIESECHNLTTLAEIVTEIVDCQNNFIEVETVSDSTFTISYLNKQGKVRTVQAIDNSTFFTISQFELESLVNKPGDSKSSHLVKKTRIDNFNIETVLHAFEQIERISKILKDRE